MIKISGLWRTSVNDDKHFILSSNFNAAHISFILVNCHVFYILKEQESLGSDYDNANFYFEKALLLSLLKLSIVLLRRESFLKDRTDSEEKKLLV